MFIQLDSGSSLRHIGTSRVLRDSTEFASAALQANFKKHSGIANALGDTHRRSIDSAVWSQLNPVADFGPSKVSRVIDEGADDFVANKHLGPEAKTPDSSGKGFAAEHFHATTFNANATQKSLDIRCDVLKSTGKLSPDLELTNGEKVQLKYGRPEYVSATTKGLNDEGYGDQQRVMPQDHPNEGKYSVSKGTTIVEGGHAKSCSLSNEEALELANATKEQFKQKVIDKLELKKEDLQKLRKPMQMTIGTSRNVYQSKISETGTPLDDADVHLNINGGLGVRESTSDRRLGTFANVGVNAGISKQVWSGSTQDGRTIASVSASASVAAGASMGSSGRNASLYAGAHLHGRLTHHITDNTSVGVHGAGGVSNYGVEASAGVHGNHTNESLVLNKIQTCSATINTTNGALCGINTSLTVKEEGIFFDEETSDSLSVNSSGVNISVGEKTINTSQHANAAMRAAATQMLVATATKGISNLSADDAKYVALASTKSMAGSVANKAVHGAVKCPTTAGVIVSAGLSLASNASELADPTKREQAAKAIAKDTARAACAGLAMKAMAGRLPGAAGAAAQCAAAVPDLVGALSDGNSEKAKAIAKDTAVTAAGTWAGLEAGTAIGACFGPLGAAAGGLIGSVVGGLGVGWLSGK